MIRVVEPKDAKAINNIYNYYIENTTITFEEVLLTPSEMESRISIISTEFPYYVYEEDGEVLGYAYANTWKSRSAFRFSVESTIYLKNGLGGRGIGRKLYTQLIKELRARGVHSVIGGITIPNPGSVKLHENIGFTKLGQFHEVGYKKEMWIDVGYWELLLK